MRTDARLRRSVWTGGGPGQCRGTPSRRAAHAGTGGHGGGVVGSHIGSETNEVEHPLVGDSVVDEASLAPRLDEAAGDQTAEMCRDPALGQSEALDALGARALGLGD